MRGNKEGRPEQVRLGEEIMQFLVKRETSLADAVDALTTLMLNVLARNFGKRNEFSRFYEQVSTFLGPTERDLAIVPLIPLPGAARVPPRTVMMAERPAGILRLSAEVGELMAKWGPKSLGDVRSRKGGRVRLAYRRVLKMGAVGRAGSVEHCQLLLTGAYEYKSRQFPPCSPNDNCCKQAVTLIDPISASIEQAIGDWGVGVDSAVAEEGPVAADVFEGLQVDVAH
jgi:hypothetical protein